MAYEGCLSAATANAALTKLINFLYNCGCQEQGAGLQQINGGDCMDTARTTFDTWNAAFNNAIAESSPVCIEEIVTGCDAALGSWTDECDIGGRFEWFEARIDCYRCRCTECEDLEGEEYTITFSGLGGAFAGFNGSHTVTMDGSCSATGSTPYLSMEYEYTGEGYKWRVRIAAIPPPMCNATFHGPTDECDPTGSYTMYQCRDTMCGGACAASSGATCVVS
jgi:hypothetical protein